MSSYEKTGIAKALKCFGGFVRYYDTTEPLPELAGLVSAGCYRNILACCAGGDQALTMLGCSAAGGNLWAVDINPAQLFVLAAKARFLKQKRAMPSFGQLKQEYPGRIAAMQKNIHNLHKMYLYNTATGKQVPAPLKLADRYSLVVDDRMFVLPRSGPYWQKDLWFTARVSARLNKLQFACMDIFDSPDHFKKGAVDLIYLSDIFWPQVLAYHQARLARMVRLLRVGGVIVSYLDEGDDFMGQGISPGRLLLQQAGKLGLRAQSNQGSGKYLVLQRIRP